MHVLIKKAGTADTTPVELRGQTEQEQADEIAHLEQVHGVGNVLMTDGQPVSTQADPEQEGERANTADVPPAGEPAPPPAESEGGDQ